MELTFSQQVLAILRNLKVDSQKVRNKALSEFGSLVHTFEEYLKLPTSYALKRFCEPLEIFGSISHGTNLPSSDLDVVVVTTEQNLRLWEKAHANYRKRATKKLRKFLSRVNSLNGRIRPHTLSGGKIIENRDENGQKYLFHFKKILFPQVRTKGGFELDLSWQGDDIVLKKRELYSNFAKHYPLVADVILFIKFFLKKFVSSRNGDSEREKYPGGVKIEFFLHWVVNKMLEEGEMQTLHADIKNIKKNESKFFRILKLSVEQLLLKTKKNDTKIFYDEVAQKMDKFVFRGKLPRVLFRSAFSVLLSHLENEKQMKLMTYSLGSNKITLVASQEIWALVDERLSKEGILTCDLAEMKSRFNMKKPPNPIGERYFQRRTHQQVKKYTNDVTEMKCYPSLYPRNQRPDGTIWTMNPKESLRSGLTWQDQTNTAMRRGYNDHGYTDDVTKMKNKNNRKRPPNPIDEELGNTKRWNQRWLMWQNQTNGGYRRQLGDRLRTRGSGRHGGNPYPGPYYEDVTEMENFDMKIPPNPIGGTHYYQHTTPQMVNVPIMVPMMSNQPRLMQQRRFPVQGGTGFPVQMPVLYNPPPFTGDMVPPSIRRTNVPNTMQQPPNYFPPRTQHSPYYRDAYGGQMRSARIYQPRFGNNQEYGRPSPQQRSPQRDYPKKKDVKKKDSGK